jgi:hypothetical protein
MTDTSRTKKRPKGKATNVEETGEVWDIAAESERCQRNARLIVRLFNGEELNDFITDAVMVAPTAASQQTGVDFRQGEDFDLKGLANLLAVTGGMFTLKVEPEMDAAALLSAVIKCPDLPERLRYELANVVTEELTNKVDTDAPEILRAMLEQYAEGVA